MCSAKRLAPSASLTMKDHALERWHSSHCQLPIAGALAIARGIDDAGTRARALAEVAPRLLAEDQPDVLAEALTAAREI